MQSNPQRTDPYKPPSLIQQTEKEDDRLIKIIAPLSLLHDNLGTHSLQGLDDLLRLLLGHRLLHHLGYRLNELLAVDEGKAEQTLDLLDNLSLGGSIHCLKLQVEKSLFLRGGSSLFFLSSGGSGSTTTGTGSNGEATNGEVGDIQAGLYKRPMSVRKQHSRIINPHQALMRYTECQRVDRIAIPPRRRRKPTFKLATRSAVSRSVNWLI